MLLLCYADEDYAICVSVGTRPIRHTKNSTLRASGWQGYGTTSSDSCIEAWTSTGKISYFQGTRREFQLSGIYGPDITQEEVHQVGSRKQYLKVLLCPPK